MSRIDFYHLKKQSLDEVLPKLVEKAYGLNKNIKILIGNEERIEFLNSLLWTFNDEQFIPHGSKKDGFSELQPIYLSSDKENPNSAVLLFIVDDADINLINVNDFERIFYFWKLLKNNENQLYYWQQNITGNWEQKKLR